MRWIIFRNLTYNHNKFATKKKAIMICDDEPDVLLSFELKRMLDRETRLTYFYGLIWGQIPLMPVFI
jgi:hypothetical protein